MKQVVKKAAELGFTIIGYHQDENLISNCDLTNLATLIEKLQGGWLNGRIENRRKLN